MTFALPLALLTLLVVPLALGAYLLLLRRRMSYALRYTNIEVLAGVAESSRWRRRAPVALFLLALAALAAGLARPHVGVTAERRQGTIVLTIDTSGSMRAEDVKPTRLAAAQAAARAFLDKLPKGFRVGVVAFSSDAYVAAPVTDDHDVAREAIGFFSPGMGTAIGDALARSVGVARARPDAGSPEGLGEQQPAVPAPRDERPTTAIVLLSDGFQTRGVLQPLEGAARAKRAGIPVYTVALGTPQGVVEFRRFGFVRRIPVPPDPQTLAQIAETTGGESFAVRDADRLKQVYEHLGTRLGRKKEQRELTFVFAAGGALLALAAGLLGGRWLPRLP